MDRSFQDRFCRAQLNVRREPLVPACAERECGFLWSLKAGIIVISGSGSGGRSMILQIIAQSAWLKRFALNCVSHLCSDYRYKYCNL